MATIEIQNLKLQTIIGTKEEERKNKQEVIINIKFDYDASKASKSDRIDDAVDYEALNEKIIQKVESSDFFLLEKLAGCLLDITLEDPLIKEAWVRVDKPKALRQADSVSVSLNRKQ